MRTKKSKNQNHVIKPPVKLDWSDFQKNIFRNVAQSTGNTAIIARAGSSKTTSLVEALRYVPRGKKILVAAFNKPIAEELKSRVPSYAEAMTLHSLGYRAVRNRFGEVVLDNKKCLTIVNNMMGDEDYDLNIEIVRAVSLCKSTLSDTPNKILDLMDKYDIEPSPFSREKFAELIIKVLGECKKQTNIIDFDDMIYFPFVYRLNVGFWDYIFIDEAQDMSYSQLILALSAAKPDSRIFVFLDDRQAIYGFRGCDIESVRTILDRLNPTKLSLPISYRCPKKVVEMAKEIVSDIQSAPNAIDGEIEEIDIKKLIDLVKVGDYVISRTNAPLIKICLSLLRQKIPANIQGRDLGANLLHFVKKSKSKTIEAFLKYLEEWRIDEIKRLTAERKDVSVAIDKAETLSSLCEECKSIKELKSNIEKLFDDIEDENGRKRLVLCGTTHRLKGTETDNVFLLDWTYRKGVSEQEDNIFYVGITRTKRKLYLVYKDGKKQYHGADKIDRMWDIALHGDAATLSADQNNYVTYHEKMETGAIEEDNPYVQEREEQQTIDKYHGW